MFHKQSKVNVAPGNQKISPLITKTMVFELENCVKLSYLDY